MSMLTFEKVVVKTLPSGDQITIKKYHLKGTQNGPHCYIQAGIHGAELQGSAVISSLIEKLRNSQNLCGSITFIPNANPMAINNKFIGQTFGRINPVTGVNWNRSYFNVEVENYDLDDHKFKEALLTKITQCGDEFNEDGKLHKILQSEAHKADIVLDLHTGPKACEYIYSQSSLLEDAKYFRFPYLILIPPVFAGALDEASFCPWHKRETLTGRKNNFSSYTIELGSEETINFDMANKQSENIINFLAHKGMILNTNASISGPQLYSELSNFETLYSPQTGLFEFNVQPGLIVEKGDKLGVFLSFTNEQGPLKKEYCANQKLAIINHHQTSNVSEGIELFQILKLLKEC
ncbi:MAG: succinylglutamate desuccinylase/aspartoacylase family protein [Halobacteriovoraceae bacterium]|nr:succinylglutamate desuccinylase/aspartoacylase family protein [Halobacteriovoraceae bacterium]